MCYSSSATNWASGEDDHVVARAEFDFSAASDEEISLRTGDMINLAPKGESSRITFSSLQSPSLSQNQVSLNDNYDTGFYSWNQQLVGAVFIDFLLPYLIFLFHIFSPKDIGILVIEPCQYFLLMIMVIRKQHLKALNTLQSTTNISVNIKMSSTRTSYDLLKNCCFSAILSYLTKS